MKDPKSNKPGQIDKNKKPMPKDNPSHQSNKNIKGDKSSDDQCHDSKGERKLSSNNKNASKMHTPMKIQE